MKRYQPEDEVLDRLLRDQKMLTATWYARISGQMPWKNGEKDALASKMNSLDQRITERIGKPEAEELDLVLERNSN